MDSKYFCPKCKQYWLVENNRDSVSGYDADYPICSKSANKWWDLPWEYEDEFLAWVNKVRKEKESNATGSSNADEGNTTHF